MQKGGDTKLVVPQCVACSTASKKEFPFSLQKEMRDFASKYCKKAKAVLLVKLGRNLRKEKQQHMRRLL